MKNIIKTKHVLWLLMEHDINRYLMSNAEGRQDGYAKAMHHIKLCEIYVAGIKGCSIDKAGMIFNDGGESFLYEDIHDKTQALTAYMDEVIGFPITGRPDYDRLAPKFFREFVKLAKTAI